MSTLDTFHQRVSRAINRGKVFDGDIPSYARNAVKTLEDINNWKHMWVEDEAGSITVDTNVITPSLSVKSVRIVAVTAVDSLPKILKKVSRDQVLFIGTGPVPSAYWMSTQDEIRVDSEPDVALPYSISYYAYSTYDNSLPWLTVSEGLLLAQTILEMSPLFRDDKITQRYVAQKGEKLGVLEESQLVHEFDAQDNQMVPFANEAESYLRSTLTPDDV